MNLEVFPADCPNHAMFSSHAAYLFRLLFGPCMLFFKAWDFQHIANLFLYGVATIGTPMFCNFYVKNLRCRTVPSLWTLGHN